MAIIGLSKPYFAKYSNNGTTITYSDGGLMGKAVEMSIEPSTTDDSNLHADNAIAESERSFSGGSGTIKTDHLTNEVSKAILGLKEQAIPQVEGMTDTEVKELIFDDDMATPYLGIGHIVKAKKGGVNVWRAIILTKVKFSLPSDAATTQGESIEWQTPELSYTIMKDDSAKHMWKRQADFTNETDAESYIKNILSITGV